MEDIKIDKLFKINNRDVIVVGCSAGPDSMALMDMLVKARDKYNLFLICAHVNHNVRKESIEEARFMQEYCEKNNICFETMTIENYGEDNFHNEARNIRYNFFEKIVEKYHAEYLMTAHHADDLMETILMRIVRGSNLNGYSGFKKVVEKNNYKLVRPLISLTKDDLLQYDIENNIKFYIDSSNNKMKYTRNRYRKIVLPFLKKEDKNVHLKFLKFSTYLNQVNEFIERKRDEQISKVVEDGKIVISKFILVDEFLQKEILYHFMQQFYHDDLLLVNDKHINLLDSVINGNKKNVIVNLPNEVNAIREYDYFYLKKQTEELTLYEVEINDHVELPNHKRIDRISYSDDDSNNICRLLSSEVKLPLIVRTRKLGDRVNIKGMAGSKKVKDVFINEKISKNDRDLWPIVVDSLGRIVWIPGLRKTKFNKNVDQECDIILRYY